MLYADDNFLFLSAIFSGLSVDRTFLKADGLHIYIFCLISYMSEKTARALSAAPLNLHRL